MSNLRQVIVLGVAGALAALPGCVVESQKSSTGRYMGTPVQPGSARTSTTASVAPPKVGGSVPVLPSGPVAAPAVESRTISNRVSVGVVPLGTILYDGQALPLVSPDGKFIAVQEGEAPSWEDLLSEPAAGVPNSTGLAVYQVGEHDLKRVVRAEELPRGLMLGRASDDRGFLVEAPQPDGSRWIGQVAWLGGGFQWLVQGPNVNAHAVITSKGELIYTSRTVESDAAGLVIQSSHGDQTVRAPADGLFAFPMCTDDPEMLYVLHLSPTTMEVEAIRLDRGGAAESDRAPRFGAVVARKGVAPKGDMTLAFQMASTVQPAMPLDKGTAAHGAAALTVLHPRLLRMAEFKLDTVSFEPLAAKSFCAIASQDPNRRGYYCATEKGLVFTPAFSQGLEDADVKVLVGPYVPRRIRGTPESMMLFGPVKGRADQLEVVKLVVGEGADAAGGPKGPKG